MCCFDFLKKEKIVVENFEDCVRAGNPVMESYPRQCRDMNTDKSFTEELDLGSSQSEIGEDEINTQGKDELILLDNPLSNQEITSPLLITGEAVGTWFFEGDFPVILANSEGEIIAEGFVTAKDEWMTEEFVQFEGTLEFEKPEFGETGTLILKKDNPSDLSELDDSLEIPIRFE